MFVSTQSVRFSPRYWHDKKGAASIIEKMTIMRNLIMKDKRKHIPAAGYMYITPVPFRHGDEREGARAAVAPASDTGGW